MKASDLNVTTSNGRVYLLDIKGDSTFRDETLLVRFSYIHGDEGAFDGRIIGASMNQQNGQHRRGVRLVFEPIASTLPLADRNVTVALRESIF